MSEFPVVALPGSEPGSEDEAVEAAGLLPGDEPHAAARDYHHKKKKKASGYHTDTDTESEAESEAFLPGDDAPKTAAAAYMPTDDDVDKVRALMASMKMQVSKKDSEDDNNSSTSASSRYSDDQVEAVRQEYARLAASAQAPRHSRASKVDALQKELNAPRAAARTTVTKWRTQHKSGKSITSSGGFSSAR